MSINYNLSLSNGEKSAIDPTLCDDINTDLVCSFHFSYMSFNVPFNHFHWINFLKIHALCLMLHLFLNFKAVFCDRWYKYQAAHLPLTSASMVQSPVP